MYKTETGGSVDVTQTCTRQRLEVLLMLHRHVQGTGSSVDVTPTYARQRLEVLLMLHRHVQDRDWRFC